MRVLSIGLLALVLVSCSRSHHTPPLREVAAKQAVFVSAMSTTHRPCTGSGYAYSDLTGDCYQVSGSPIVEPEDISTKMLSNNREWAAWIVYVKLTDEAGKRLDSWAAAHPGHEVAVVDDSVALFVAPINDPPLHGEFSIGGKGWTQADAQRAFDALGGSGVDGTNCPDNAGCSVSP